MDLHAFLVKHLTYQYMYAREGITGLFDYLEAFEASQWATADELHALQCERLARLVRRAYDHTRYWRRVLDERGLRPEDIREPADLDRLPMLTKDLIREHYDDMLADNLARNEIHHSETGGTSGVKMRFVRDNACLAPKAAATIRHERWTGWDIGKRRGLVWPAEQDYVGYRTWKAKLRNHLCHREIVLPAATLDDATTRAYLLEVARKRPWLVRGFATPLHLVAQYLDQHPDVVCRVPAIISTGEPLFPHQRALLEKVFTAEVFDSYGAREVALVAQECPSHHGMHINAESVIVEAVGPEIDGQRKLLVTDLWNFGLPFIRYDIGDMGRLSDAACPCGRGLPIMEMGVGREADVMYTPDGRVVAAVTMVLYLVDNGPPVGQVQVEQDALDHVVVRISDDPAPDDTLFDFYRGEIARLFGGGMRVTFEVVDAIPNEASGKYKFARCTIPEADIPSTYRA